MRRPGIVARASCAVETPPSTEFSIAIIAASTALDDVGERLADVAHRPPVLAAGLGHLASAASVKVPAGPR